MGYSVVLCDGMVCLRIYIHTLDVENGIRTRLRSVIADVEIIFGIRVVTRERA